MAKRERGVSINPEDFSKSGILNDADVEWLETLFMTGEDAAEQTEGIGRYDYYEESLFLAANLGVRSGEMKGQEVWQYWSSGKLIYFEPSLDGRIAKPVGQAEKLSDGCNAYIVLASILNAGFPRDQFDDDVSIFNTMLARMIRVDQKKRPGLDSDDGKMRTVLTVESILDESPVGLPGKKKSRGKSKLKAVEAAGNEDFDELARTTIVQILIDAGGGPVKRSSIFGRMLKILQISHPDNFKEIIAISSSEGFLEDSKDWEFDGKELSIGE